MNPQGSKLTRANEWCLYLHKVPCWLDSN